MTKKIDVTKTNNNEGEQAQKTNDMVQETLTLHRTTGLVPASYCRYATSMAFPFCLYLASTLPRFINSMVAIMNLSLVAHCWSRSDYALDSDKWRVIGAWPDVSLRRSYELYGNDMSHSPVHWVPRQVSHLKLLILLEYMNSPRYLIGNIYDTHYEVFHNQI